MHRDVKPANVLLDDDGHVYLTDFGVTKQARAATRPRPGSWSGRSTTWRRSRSGRAVDARTDCYALACVLYECLAGAPPFRRETEAETLWAHMQEEPASIPGHPALDPVLRRALAKDKDERYETALS